MAMHATKKAKCDEPSNDSLIQFELELRNHLTKENDAKNLNQSFEEEFAHTKQEWKLFNVEKRA